MVDKDIIDELRRVYGSLVYELIDRLKRPPRRLYMRVNQMKASRDQILSALREAEIQAFPDEYVEEAIFVVLEGPLEVSCDSRGAIVVDDKAANSLLVGANLYRPGVVKSTGFRRGEILSAYDKHGNLVACLEAVVDSSQLRLMSSGLVALNISSPYRAPRIRELNLYEKGYLYPQSLPSMIASIALSPSKGDLILDMNAAPGGKTSHIVELTRGEARVVAVDRPSKMNELKRNLSRMGLDKYVILLPHDSRYLDRDVFKPEMFDKIIIDPPCSNLGVRPISSKPRSMRDVKTLAEYQYQFIKAATRLLKKGGRLVYSTCTLTFVENEENIWRAVKELGLESVDPGLNYPFVEKTRYRGVISYRFSPLTMDMPGFFIAVLEKRR